MFFDSDADRKYFHQIRLAVILAVVGLVAVPLAGTFGLRATLDQFLVHHGFGSTAVGQWDLADFLVLSPFALAAILVIAIHAIKDGAGSKEDRRRGWGDFAVVLRILFCPAALLLAPYSYLTGSTPLAVAFLVVSALSAISGWIVLPRMLPEQFPTTSHR